ncbi:MAG: DNA repair protein RadC [Candidatus Methanoperedens sp.]|nr:DNA repair protein RadC [Candidatus Methanoperedens sp.]
MNGYKLRICDFPPEDRPQNRLLSQGPGSLSNNELLSLVINSGTVGENVLSLSQRILATYDIQQLSAVDISQLMKIHGIKKGKAARIAACFELARRLQSFSRDSRQKANSPEDVYRLLYPHMREKKKETFIELCLDTKNQVLRQDVISIGSLSANIVHPREVFKTALLESAAHIIVVHNHPSGDPTPSREDIEITKRLLEAGKLIGVDLLDHVIIGDGRHFSMKEAGHI